MLSQGDSRVPGISYLNNLTALTGSRLSLGRECETSKDAHMQRMMFPWICLSRDVILSFPSQSSVSALVTSLLNLSFAQLWCLSDLLKSFGVAGLSSKISSTIYYLCDLWASNLKSLSLISRRGKGRWKDLLCSGFGRFPRQSI